MLPWVKAWAQSAYGPTGFYRRESPIAHFRTSAHSQVLAAAIATLAHDCGLRQIIDLGAGSGELLAEVAELAPTIRLTGWEVRPRPPKLDPRIEWLVSPAGQDPSELPTDLSGALVVANEWLDDIPAPIVEHDGQRWRAVQVSTAGDERLGPSPTLPELAWLERWWPVPPEAEEPPRAEVGLPRDQAWARLVAAAAPDTVLLAIDYSHTRADRPPTGSLAGYRAGRRVPPAPDGTCNLTAHVALDAVAAASTRPLASVITTQRQALAALGVVPTPPSQSLEDPAEFLGQLERSSGITELADPGGMGSFGWLLQSPNLRPTGQIAESLVRLCG